MATRREKKKDLVLKGTAASPGIAIGKIYVLGSNDVSVDYSAISSHEVDAKIKEFQTAVADAKDEIRLLKAQTERALGPDSAKIFDVQLFMLDDEAIVHKTIEKIRAELAGADYSFYQVVTELEESMATMKDEYMRARAADLRDIKKRVIFHIQGVQQKVLSKLSEPAIIVAKELTPSDTISLDRTKVLGFATDFGGRTSHAAIMARSLKVPSVVGLVVACQRLKTGDYAILDAHEGLLVIHPSDTSIRKYRKLNSDYQGFEQRLRQHKELPPVTKDGKDIEVAANIEFSVESSYVKEQGLHGIGLFRTEYLFFTRPHFPSEEEQFNEYAGVLKTIPDQPVIIRTFDFGGDKIPDSFSFPPEDNPFLGLRAIRVYQKYQDLFRTQLRAILRASIFGKMHIMFPMISCVSEIRFCQQLLQEVKDELSAEGIPFARDIPVGAMIEVPSAAVISDLIAKECDFLSIGTNDLIQYSLAVDRGNELVAYLYKPYNPAVLRFIRDIIKRGHEQGVWVGLCGEMASDPLATMVLIGMGLDEFSVSPVSIPLIKTIIRRVEFGECQNLAERVLSFSTPDEVEKYLGEVFKRKFQDLTFCL